MEGKIELSREGEGLDLTEAVEAKLAGADADDVREGSGD